MNTHVKDSANRCSKCLRKQGGLNENKQTNAFLFRKS